MIEIEETASDVVRHAAFVWSIRMAQLEHGGQAGQHVVIGEPGDWARASFVDRQRR